MNTLSEKKRHKRRHRLRVVLMEWTSWGDWQLDSKPNTVIITRSHHWWHTDVPSRQQLDNMAVTHHMWWPITFTCQYFISTIYFLALNLKKMTQNWDMKQMEILKKQQQQINKEVVWFYPDSFQHVFSLVVLYTSETSRALPSDFCSVDSIETPSFLHAVCVYNPSTAECSEVLLHWQALQRTLLCPFHNLDGVFNIQPINEWKSMLSSDEQHMLEREGN